MTLRTPTAIVAGVWLGGVLYVRPVLWTVALMVGVVGLAALACRRLWVAGGER